MDRPAQPPRAGKTPDSACADAVDLARNAAEELAGGHGVGEHLGVDADADRVATHRFAARHAGYRGWVWSVTLARASRQKTPTVDEVVLLPGPGAIVAPPWVPWEERVLPGDVGPGDLLPAPPDDPRLAPGYTSVDEPDVPSTPILGESAPGRAQVLSADGRAEAAERWYAGSHGPDAPSARSAPGTCATCGFFLAIAGPLGRLFGVCANVYSPSDGRVVSLDHGCGAHSEVTVERAQAAPPPDPVFDTVSYDELERF